jgi:hypothetical protein
MVKDLPISAPVNMRHVVSVKVHAARGFIVATQTSGGSTARLLRDRGSAETLAGVETILKEKVA